MTITPENIVFLLIGFGLGAISIIFFSYLRELRLRLISLEEKNFETKPRSAYNSTVNKAVRRRKTNEPASAQENPKNSLLEQDAAAIAEAESDENRFFDVTDSSSKNILRQRQASSEFDLRKRIDTHRQEINNAPKPQTQ